MSTTPDLYIDYLQFVLQHESLLVDKEKEILAAKDQLRIVTSKFTEEHTKVRSPVIEDLSTVTLRSRRSTGMSTCI